METRAPFVIVGAFVLAAAVAVFGFVYWLHNTGGLGARTEYHVQFEGSVPGLLVGAGVLFNGIRVGEVTALALAPDDARRVDATISVAVATPVRSDTRVGLEFQGLTGVPVVALEGGKLPAGGARVTTLLADAGAGQSMTQAARDALRRVDTVLADNADPLKRTIANLQVFSEGLARNTGKLDSIVAGLEKMTGGGAAAAPKTTYDLRAVQDVAAPGRLLKAQLGLPEPSAVAMLQTQRFLFSPAKEMPAFAEAMWADSIPKLLQARLIEGFENYDIGHAPLRAADAPPADVQLVLDVRRFEVVTDGEPTAVIALSARLLDKEGKVTASRLFEQRETLDKLDPASAVAAYNNAFARLSREIIGWTEAAS
jgi:phospholipid/cholesterol/gamma-HCH transport system substrate-binding protein